MTFEDPSGGDVVNAASPAVIAWFHAFNGIAGDMALGALVDAGADLDEVRTLLERLSVKGWELDRRPVMRGMLACTQVLVTVDDDVETRTWSDIVELINGAGYPARLADRARAVFSALARVEGRLHGVPVDEVHFHEVGGVDAIVDVVGTCAALELLDVDEVHAGPVSVGVGAITAAHGRFPNPAPAVVRLLEGAPVTGIDIDVELTTPTGAAIVAALAASWGPLPAMVPSASGFGAGTRELIGMPNATQVIIGTRRGDHQVPGPHGHGHASDHR
jgi:hypothetical protein